MPIACDLGDGGRRSGGDRRSACDMAGMGGRRSWLRHRLRALSRRRGPRCDRQGARGFFHFRMIMAAIDRQEAFSGTKEVATPLALDLARLKAFLASRLPGGAAVLCVR